MKLVLTICVSLAALIVVVPLYAQCRLPQTKAWIAVSNAVGYRDTLWFGFDSTATCGEDPTLCEFYPAEPCSAPSNIFCTYWSSPCGPGPGAIVLLRYDFRRYIHPTQVDTHRVAFQPGESGYPLTFRWSRVAIRSLCDSAVLRYWSGIYVRYRLDLVDSLVLTDESVLQLQLFRYGQRLNPVQVQETASGLPRSFGLTQNYPNPSNPSTTFTFDVPYSSFTTLKVFDVLGREVATLVNGVEEPGNKRVRWDASNVSSGVYFCRLSARDFVLTKKLVVVK